MNNGSFAYSKISSQLSTKDCLYSKGKFITCAGLMFHSRTPNFIDIESSKTQKIKTFMLIENYPDYVLYTHNVYEYTLIVYRSTHPLYGSTLLRIQNRNIK